MGTQLTAGTRVGPYEILSALGRGGGGDVYRARDTRVGRLVALKLVRGAASGEEARRFRNEVQATAALQHPGIVALHDVGEHQGQRFLATELLDGQTLRHLAAGGPLGLGRAAGILAQVARALAAAHERGIVHRDLKPANILVTHDGAAKVLDFGLAKLAADGETALTGLLEGETAPGTVLGSLGYMAPEQVSAQPADHRADLFAIGAIFYELVTGQRAFAGSSAFEVMNATLTAEPPLLATLPPRTAQLIGRCLQKDPARRIQSARELADELDDLLLDSGEQWTPVAGHTAPQRRPRRSRKRLAIALALGAAAAIAGLFAIALATTRGAERSIAVFAFDAPSAPQDARLGGEVAELLLDALNGDEAGTIDARTAGAIAPDLEAARARAARLGAALFVLGRAADIEGQLLLQATLYDASGARLAHASAHGPRGELFKVAAAVAASLKQALPDRSQDGSFGASLARVPHRIKRLFKRAFQRRHEARAATK